MIVFDTMRRPAVLATGPKAVEQLSKIKLEPCVESLKNRC